MMKYLLSISVLISLLFVTDKNLERARAYFAVKDYVNTVYYYERATKVTDSSDVRKMAESLLKTNQEKSAEKWYSKLCRNKVMDQHLIDYGQCLRRLGKYKVAKYQFGKVQKKEKINHLISSCDSAILWGKNTSKYQVVNLKKLNTTFSEIAPVIHKEGVVFCSDRESVIIKKKDQTTHRPVYNLWISSDTSNFKHTRKWAATLNTLQQDGPCSFTKKYDKVYMSKTILTGLEQNHKPRLYTANKLPLRWGDKKEFIFNDTLFTFTQPFITPDENILFFVSDMPGGKGGLDIYACFNYEGKWTDPINLGAPINTKGNEIFPFLTWEGELFFSSDFHPGFGGYDIFSSKQENGKFKTVHNLKQPINSSSDDFSFTIDSTFTKMYFSSNRPGGKGLDDLYKVIK